MSLYIPCPGDRCFFMKLPLFLSGSAALTVACTVWFSSRLPETPQPDTFAVEMTTAAVLRAPSVYITHGGECGMLEA